MATAAVQTTPTNTQPRQVGKGAVLDAYVKAQRSHQPLVLFCPGHRNDVQKRKEIEAEVLNTLKLSFGSPVKFTVVYLDPIRNEREKSIIVGKHRSGIKFFA